MKKVFKYLIIIILFLIISFLITPKIIMGDNNQNPIEEPVDKQIEKPVIENKSQEELFSNCMKEENVSFKEKFVLEIETLQNEFSNYNVSILYHNLLDDNKIFYNENKDYYSASTVKPVVALYYYEMASKGLIDLDQEVIFKERYWNESIRKPIGLDSVVSLRTLIKYAMINSDNGAHKLLVEHIGYEALNNFIKETMIVENAFFPNDLYGKINAIDGDTIINTVYQFIEKNGSLGQELKDFMLNATLNSLKIDGIDVAHKYGWWKEDFHDIGIIYDDYPYTLVVLTKHGENNEYFSVIKTLHKKIYKFHTDYIKSKTEFCLNNR